MQLKLWWAAGALLFIAVAIHADVAQPGGVKYADPRVRFLGVHRLSNYLFFLHYETGNDVRALNPASIPVKNDDVITLNKTGRFLSRTRLLAITPKDFDKWRIAHPLRKEIDEKTLGVMTAGFLAPANTAVKFATTAPISEYRVSIKDNKLDVQPLPNSARR